MKKDSGGTTHSSKGARGQTVMTGYGRDNSSMDVPNAKGKEMGGGISNLSHSLSGASAVQSGDWQEHILANPKVMLDRSRAFAEIHGEGVIHAFEQDGLPFNQMGEIVDSLIKTKEQKAIVEKKLKRLAKLAAGAPVEPEEEKKATNEQDDDLADLGKEINLEAWLKDEVQYAPNILFTEAKKRFGKHFSTFHQLAEYLVFEENILGPTQVPTKLGTKAA